MKDTNKDNNHTYYGNGCTGDWNSGSQIACSPAMVSTYDGEDQQIGVYYTFQAATSGSGGTTFATDNSNVPDTFCPLGWQSPYSGTGGDYYDKSRSWKFLFDKYSYDGSLTGSQGARSYPISIVMSGFYNWDTGLLMFMDGQVFLHASTTYSNYNAYTSSVYQSGRTNATSFSKSGGTVIRCIIFFSIPSSTARWKELI